MSLRQAVLVSHLAIAQVNALQLDVDNRADVHPLEVNPMDTSKFVNWQMCDNSATSNNIGGVGPDKAGPKEMRVPAIKTVEIGEETFVLDLVVTTDSAYESNSPDVNRVENCLGYTNVQTGTSAKMDFRFALPGESKAWVPPKDYVPKFKFSIYDMDGSKNGIREQVTFDTPINHLYLDDGHSFHPHGDNTLESPLVFDSGDIVGNGADNPKLNEDGILHLDEDQSSRAITVAYKGTTEWSISFAAVGKRKRKPSGRVFMWSGASDVPDCEACEEWSAPTFPWSLCSSALTSNNLGGQGPYGLDEEDAAEEIRYSSVAKVHGQVLDLRVTANDGYSPYNVSRNTVIDGNRSDASIHGCFGAINVKAASKVRLTFEFIDHETGVVAKLPEDEGFGFSVFDLDQNNESNNEERVYFDTPYAMEAYEGEHVEKVKNEERTFRSTAFGSGSDNIYDKDDANTDVQIGRTVKVMYNGEMTGGVAKWKVTFDVRGGMFGRNFLFGGCVHKKEDVAHPK